MRIWPFSRGEVKNLPTQQSQSVLVGGGAEWKRGNVKNFIEEGYQLNPIVYRAINEIVKGIADLTLEVHRGAGDQKEIVETGPVIELMARPNPMQGYDGFIKQAFVDYLIFGEMAILSPQEGRPLELWPISPLEIQVKPGQGRIPSAYVHKVDTRETSFAVDRISARSQLFFFKSYNPGNIWRGQSPLVAASLAADTHNAGVKWNYKLLRNSARPSGIVTFDGDGPGVETLNRIREYFKRHIQGEDNAGEVGMLFGGAQWTPTDNSPRDMDFLNTQKEMAKLIAAAYGVPLPLIDNEAATFNNMEAAKEQFYTDTIIPMFNEFLSQFGSWLLPQFDPALSFQVDLDDIPALEASRARKFDRTIKAIQAGLITVDEGREAIGYDPLGGAAAILDPMAGMFSRPDQQRNLDLAALAYGTKAD